MIARPQRDVANTSNPLRTTCPVCCSSALHAFLSVPRVPVTCTSIFATASEARAVPSGDIALCACEQCGFAFNCSFDPRLGELGARYESSQSASAHFGAFARSLADDWLTRYGLVGKTILEVGCGSGDFLRQMRAAGVGRCVGIDPLAEASTDAQLTFIAESFDPRHHNFDADALVCRHTLEHVQDVNVFLRDVRQWAASGTGRVVLFELPDAERVFAERAFWDVYYEHCNYFTERTVRAAFEQAGLEVLRIARVYNEQYLLVEAVAGREAVGLAEPKANEAIAVCDEFGHEVRTTVEQCKKSLDHLAADGPRVVLWQGAAKTVGLLSFVGDTRSIECAVDLNPQRHGLFLPGTGLPVYPPEALRSILPKHIVLMNPVYLDEVRASANALGVSAHVHSINDLLGADAMSLIEKTRRAW